jgi:hypothetical protein
MLPYVYKQHVEDVEKEEIYSPGYQGPGVWWCTVTYSMRWSHTIQFRRARKMWHVHRRCHFLFVWGWLGDAQLVLSEHLVDACSSTSWNCLNMCATWVLCAVDCGREVLKEFLRCWEMIRAEDLCLEERRPLKEGGCCTVAGSAETLGATLGIRCVRRISHKFDVEPAWSHWCIAIDLINHRREQEISLPKVAQKSW